MKKLIERKTDTLFSSQNGVMMVLFCLMSFGLTACSDDDDDDADTESYSSLLLGTWYASYYEYGEYWYDTIIFKSNGTYYYYEDGELDLIGTWSLSGNKLMIYEGSEENIATIVSLTEDLLILKYVEDDETYTETWYR